MAKYPTVQLSSGQHIPVVGLGMSHDGGYSHNALLYALGNCGIRHIDTAKRYGNEELVGKAISESGVKREELWITTKLWPGDYGYEKATQACLNSCERLGLEYLGAPCAAKIALNCRGMDSTRHLKRSCGIHAPVSGTNKIAYAEKKEKDLYLMHWPDADIPGKSAREVRAETWKALEDLYYKGICRSIGVSNFLIHHLEQLQEDCSVVPHLNQVEYHPFQRPQELVDYCVKKNIVFGGYSPLAKGEALTHPAILKIAKHYGKTPAQICIRWSIQNGIITIPKSTKENRIRENFQVFDFHLQQTDMERISSLHSDRKLIHLTYPLWKG